MSKYPLCPFYEYEDGNSLHCEFTTVKFPGVDDRRMWLKMHCCSWDFKICRFYSRLMKKYAAD